MSVSSFFFYSNQLKFQFGFIVLYDINPLGYLMPNPAYKYIHVFMICKFVRKILNKPELINS